jgi:hypothetical protein
MSVQANATNNTASSAYFYTKGEINEAVTYALSTIGNLSTSALFTNLTVSSITVNPSGAVNGAGITTTTSLIAQNGNFSTLVGSNASVGGAGLAVGYAPGLPNGTTMTPRNGSLRISQSTTSLEGLYITRNSIAFSQAGTGTSSILAACNTDSTSTPFPGIALTNVSSINGVTYQAFTNNTNFPSASISSATISSINGNKVNTNVGAYQFYDLTGLVPAVIPGSNNPVAISTLQTGLGAGIYTASVTLNATSISTPQNCFEIGLGGVGGIAAGNAIMSIVPANSFAASGFQITYTNTNGFKSSNGTIPVNYSYSAPGSSLSNANAAGAPPNVFLQLFKVA